MLKKIESPRLKIKYLKSIKRGLGYSLAEEHLTEVCKMLSSILKTKI